MKSRLPVEWEKVRLKDITQKIGSGATPRGGSKVYIDEGISLIRSQNVLDFSFTEEGLVHIDEGAAEKLSNVKVFEKDVLINITGDSVARTCLVPIDVLPARVNQHVSIIRVDKNLANYKYISYKLHDLKRLLLSYSNSGGTRKALTKSMLEDLEFNLPLLKEQEVIAATLSALDDKIENNNKINGNLEQQAQEIFKHWFVDFEFPNENGEPFKSSGGEMVESEIGLIPEEWEVNKIGEMVDNIKESVKPGEHLSNREYLPINNLSMKSVTVQDSESYKEAKSSLVLFEKFDILIGAMRVYFHRVNLSPFKGVTRTTTFVIRSKKADELSYNLFLLNLDETISYANKTSKGTTMPYAVWENGLAEMLVANPPLNIKRAFNEIILPSLELMLNNAQENKKLSNLRDTLLPKLMSGELRIPLDE